MQVSQLLDRKSSRGSITIHPVSSIQTVVKFLDERNMKAVVVSRNGRDIEGIVTERDIVRGLSAHGAGFLAVKVQDVALHKVHTCAPDWDVYRVLQVMNRHGVEHLPVAVNGLLVGLVSLRDILRQSLVKELIR